MVGRDESLSVISTLRIYWVFFLGFYCGRLGYCGGGLGCSGSMDVGVEFLL
jgi:hypothetical protein